MTDRYILLPERGVLAAEPRSLHALTAIPPVSSLHEPVSISLDVAPEQEIRVIDTTQENGPKLVELTDDAATALNAEGTGVRAIPQVTYGLPDPRPQPQGGASAALAAATTTLQVTCTDAKTGTPVAGVRVVAFTDFVNRRGDQDNTNAAGAVTLQLAGSNVERLYAYPPAGHWGAYRATISATAPISLALEPVDLSFVDAVRTFYGASKYDPTTAVTVGVLDTGVGPHTDLNVIGGINTVTGEQPGDYVDVEGHGTHVAGLIGSNGTPPNGLRGVAPGVPIRVYRVFGIKAGGATNYAILKALIRAASDGCDIVNLSLGGGPRPDRRRGDPRRSRAGDADRDRRRQCRRSGRPP